MPQTVEQLTSQLTSSELMSAVDVAAFIVALPEDQRPKDGEALARELVKQKKLTKFQAEEVYRGKGKSLVLGNYVLIERIGAGGMGQVFKARHRRMDRLVAVKLLPPAMTKDKAAIARFEREVKAAAKLRHPNIVAADDADQANGVHFLVMELVEGSDLSALVKRNGPFSVDQAVNYIIQAARGLEAAHAEGIVHRDIKPANLLLDKKGTVKILDMGLARIEGGMDTPNQAELTSTGTVMGTVDYMAPEQALSTKTADARADIYSLGCSLYYLLIGKATYDGETLMAKLLNHREQPVPSLRAIRPEVAEQIEAVFSKMVAKKVDDRYQTMTEVIADLERCRTGGDQTATLIQSTSATSDLNLSNFLKDLSISATQPSFMPQSKPTGDRDSKKLSLIAAGIAGVLILLLGGWVIFRDRDVNEVAQVKVPKDGSVTVQTNGSSKQISKEPASKLFIHGTAFAPWLKSVQAMPAAQQVEAVQQKLKELNPRCDSQLRNRARKATPGIKRGVVIEVGIKAEHLTDVSPLRALSDLETLWFGPGDLVDLSPLSGLKLISFHCNCAGLSDLSPLAGMPLQGVDFSGTAVTSLEVLRGMPLTSVQCESMRIQDLSPLTGMKLTTLMVGSTLVSNLAPLTGMPLTDLRIDRTPVTDLTPLAGMPLTKLTCLGTKITDLTPLARCKDLQSIDLRQVKLTSEDIDALQKALPNCKISWDDANKESK